MRRTLEMQQFGFRAASGRRSEELLLCSWGGKWVLKVMRLGTVPPCVFSWGEVPLLWGR